jgi:hypothetical protein
MALVDINWHPSRKELRVFALLLLAFFAIVAGLMVFRFSATTAAGVVFAVAALISVTGLCVPSWLRPVYVGWIVAAYPIGWLVSHIVIAMLFYLVITPIGLIMRVFGRDPMHRRFDRSAPTYWKSRPSDSESRRYFRQF